MTLFYLLQAEPHFNEAINMYSNEPLAFCHVI